MTERTAGTATFTLHDLNHATLVYTVDGVVVTKELERLTFRFEDFTGNYAGGYSVRNSSCTPSTLNGIEEIGGYLTVTQSGSSMAINATASTGASCTFNATYTQTGKIGQVSGTYFCGSGYAGTFLLFEMTPTISGFTARAQGQNQYCQWSGYMGGITRAP